MLRKLILAWFLILNKPRMHKLWKLKYCVIPVSTQTITKRLSMECTWAVCIHNFVQPAINNVRCYVKVCSEGTFWWMAFFCCVGIYFWFYTSTFNQSQSKSKTTKMTASSQWSNANRLEVIYLFGAGKRNPLIDDRNVVLNNLDVWDVNKIV